MVIKKSGLENLKKQFKGSPINTIFGTFEKSHKVKFVLVETTKLAWNSEEFPFAYHLKALLNGLICFQYFGLSVFQ